MHGVLETIDPYSSPFQENNNKIHIAFTPPAPSRRTSSMSSIKAVKDKVSKVVKQAGGGGDSKYFASTKKGEVQEFKTELRSLDRAVQKEAVKKASAARNHLSALSFFL